MENLFAYSQRLSEIIAQMKLHGEINPDHYNNDDFNVLAGAAGEFTAMIPLMMLEDGFEDKVLTLIAAAFQLGIRVGKRCGTGLTLVVAPETKEEGL